MDILFALLGSPYESEEVPAPDANSLQSGYIDYGSSCDRTGTAWNDQSHGTFYGGGHRFESDEEAFITKVPSKNRR